MCNTIRGSGVIGIVSTSNISHYYYSFVLLDVTAISLSALRYSHEEVYIGVIAHNIGNVIYLNSLQLIKSIDLELNQWSHTSVLFSYLYI